MYKHSDCEMQKYDPEQSKQLHLKIVSNGLENLKYVVVFSLVWTTVYSYMSRVFQFSKSTLSA